MKCRKLKGDHIFNGYELIEDMVLVICEDGTIEGVISVSEAGEGVEYLEGILSPAFINCHCHLELSHMRGIIPEKTGLVDFVYKIITERNYSSEDIMAAIEYAEHEMYKNGIIAVGDISNNTVTLHQKQKEQLYYYNFIEALGWLPSVAQQTFEKVKNVFDLFENDLPGNHSASIVPHASYSVSEYLWQQIKPYYNQKVVSIHNQETIFEDEFFETGGGDFNRMYNLLKIRNDHHHPTKKTSLQSYFHHLTVAKNILLVHNTFTRQTDIDYIKNELNKNNVTTFFCLCVNANQYIEDALPPVNLLRKNKCEIVLGTDSLASNWSLSIADEMKTINKFFPAIPLEELLKWATINGAIALDMQDRLGSFEKGKNPGVIQFDANNYKVKRII